VNYNFDDHLNGFVSLAYTSREPTLRNLYAAEDSYFGATPQFHADTSGGAVRYDFTQPFAQPEHLLDIEIGSGYNDGTLRLQGNFYWMEFTDELVENGQVDIFGQPVTGNAERTRHVGAEIDGAWTIDRHFSLGGNFTLSRNRLVHYAVIDNGSSVTLDGNPISGFPDFLGNAQISYRLDAFTCNVSLKHVGSFYTDNYASTAAQVDAYDVLNLGILYDALPLVGGKFTIRLEVNNLTNKLYFANGQGETFYPAAERNYIVGLSAKF
jgi:iron complex outermembrane receptor protein